MITRPVRPALLLAGLLGWLALAAAATLPTELRAQESPERPEPRQPAERAEPAAGGDRETAPAIPLDAFRWTVSLRDVERRTWVVELELHHLDLLRRAGRLNADGSITLHMANWSPGAYGLGNYGRFVEDFSATTLPAATGEADAPQPLAVDHPQHDSWTIRLPEGATAIRLQYRTTTGRSQTTGRLSRARGDFLGTGMFLYLAGGTDLGATLRFADLPESWQAHCPLPETGTPGVYRADNFDVLADAPCAFGPFGSQSFRVDNAIIEIVVATDPGQEQAAQQKLRQPVERIVRAASELMDGLPFDRYVFFYHLSRFGQGGGGLEHLNSTQIWLPLRMLDTQMETVLMVTAHELFHVWNVKRLRAAPINPYDYSQLPDIDCLWFHEGVTNYYTYVLLARAGLIGTDHFYRRLASLLQRVNRTSDYYHRGECWGFLLDCLIRRRTDNRHSLDDVLHALWQRYGKDVKPFDETAGISRVITDVTGLELGYFFERWVLGDEETPVAEVLRSAGVPYEADDPERAWLGFAGRFDAASATVVVTDVVPHSRAAEADLRVGDTIRRIAGAAPDAGWERPLIDSPPGLRVQLDVARDGEGARTLTVPLGSELTGPFRIIVPARDHDSVLARMLHGIVSDRRAGTDREEDF